MAINTCKYALVSVYDKNGITELCDALVKHGYGIIATDGTGKELEAHGIPYEKCGEISGNPVCFDGFMKTLSFSIEGGIIFDRTNPPHVEEAIKYGVRDIDVVVCNFFPVAAVKEKYRSKNTEETVRYLDFGGPIMVRVAAQNYKNVVALVDPEDYALFINGRKPADLTLEERKNLARKAFGHVLDYDKDIIELLNS